jgi:hypothetical protein
VIQTCMGCGKDVDTEEGQALEWWTEEGDSGTDWYHEECFTTEIGEREDEK